MGREARVGKAFPNRWAEALSSAASLPELTLLPEKSFGTTPWDHQGPSVRGSAGHPEKVVPPELAEIQLWLP